MQNLSSVQINATSDRSLTVIVKVCVVIPIFSIFLYFIILMLHTFASHRHFLESPRYILFTYMLANDTLQLLTSVLLFLFVMAQVKFALVFCAPLLFFSTATFLNTPLILAVMSLERYVAIFYPMRRPSAWRAERIWLIILAIWLLSCVQPVVDFVLSKPRSAADVLTMPVQCKTAVLNVSPAQMLFKVVLNALFFAVVAAVILFTYVRILLGTRTMRQDRASVSKALHTVLLHGLQLLLSTSAFTIPFTEHLIVLHVGWLREHMSFLNYVSFVVMPRVLSPLIYGLRDESLRTHMRRSPLCCSARGCGSSKVGHRGSKGKSPGK
ncbi:odorant receptor 129-1 [Alosa sapidissima]|uniref:odorant receptor 129-1 n=1 Tax=Alosa sapidissima TaxID=34773 RepID=UPI001C081812|nr:odorant receptor 129-1 [Alosa sapidissima]